MPVELKVLGALRTLGRATLHDDVAEISGADAETHRKAFILFIRFVSSHFREEWIREPEGEELEQVVREFQMMGFPGAVGSMDATHVHWRRCPSGATNMHTGKEGFPTRVFNVAVTHHGKVFAVSGSQPGARNDKTIVSRWLESVRKDVECFFGRLKVRFMSLYNPIYLINELNVKGYV